MPTCKDCANFKPKDDLLGNCLATEDKLVEADRDVEDCLARAFEPKEKSQEDSL